MKKAILLTLLLLAIHPTIQLCAQSLEQGELDSLHTLILENKNDSIRGRAYNKLAFHYIFSEPDKARELLEKGLKEAEQFQLHFGKAELLNTKATYFDILGKADSAEMTFNSSLELSEKFNFKNIEVMTHNSMGLMYWKNGEFGRALEAFFKALEMNETYFEEQKESKANYLSNIGLIFQELEQYEKAISYHNQSLEIRSAENLISGEAISYANLGVCYQSLEDYSKAEQSFLKAIQLAEKAGNAWMYYSLHDNLGNVYNLTERNTEAIAAYKKSLDRPEEAGKNPKGALSACSNLASIYNKMKDPKTAILYAQQGFDILEEFPQYYLFSDGLHFAFAESQYMLGNIEQGNKSMNDFRKVLDSLFTKNNAIALAKMEKKYESAQKDKSLLEQQQTIQEKELLLLQRKNWMIGLVALIVSLSLILFILFKRKEALAQRAALELKLAQEKELTRIQQERLRISRELHDNIGSHLTLISASIEQIIHNDNPPEKEKFVQLKDYLSMSMRELRKTVWLLNKENIPIEEILLRLRDLFKPLHQNGTKIRVEAEGDSTVQLSEIQTTHLFRIIQEAINNSYKHSEGDNILVILNSKNPGELHFSIRDNGKGFDLQKTESGNGMRNMQTRISELKGHIEIKSNPEGTNISGYFPI